MAAVHPATTSFHFPAARKPPPLSFSVYTRLPPKPTNRKNYIHTKIFNTLPKPYSSNPQTLELPPTKPLIPTESSLPQQITVTEVKESVTIEQQPPPEKPVSDESKPRFNLYKYLNDKIEESVEKDYDYWQSIGTPTKGGNEFAGNNKYSTPSMFQIGLTFVAALVFDLVWSMSMAKKLNAIKKEREAKLGSTDGGRNNKSIWERWAERRRNRIEAKKEGGDVVIDESGADKKIVEGGEVDKEVHEEEKLGAKGNDSDGNGHDLERELSKRIE